MYRGRLQRDLKIWTEKGLVGPDTATAMLSEYDARPASFNLGRVLAGMAALLMAAAILLFIASNWEEIPRIGRLGGIVALIWAFHLAAAYCLTRQRAVLASVLLILGTMSFGGAMALVGQMYNLSGDALTMISLWFVAACVAAALFRSGGQVFLAGFLGWAFCVTYLWEHGDDWYGFMPWIPPVMAAVIIVLVRYLEVPRARHLAYVMIVGWVTWNYAKYDNMQDAILFAALGMAAFLAASLPLSPFHRFARTAGAAPSFYTFLLACIGLLAVHVEVEDLRSGYDFVDGGMALAATGAVTLIAVVVAIVLSGRDNGAVRYLAYFAFACEIFYLASDTIGSIIGTSGFFLIGGLVLAAGAWLVFRLERRFHREGPEVQS
jgi:uncharacterized membrane protein